MEKVIFLSYCWKDKDEANRVDDLLLSFENIRVIRDVRDLGYLDDIEEFMKQIRAVDLAILMISDGYMESINCMFEVSQIIKEKDYKYKVTPVIVKKPRIYGSDNRLFYAEYWNQKYIDYDKRIRNLKNIEDYPNLLIELKKIREICSATDEFLHFLNSKKFNSLEEHFANEFQDVFKAMGFEILPKKRVVTKSEGSQVNEFNYSIYKLDDISTATAKRYSAVILINQDYTREEIKSLILQANDIVKRKRYSKKFKSIFREKDADVVWLYFARDLFDIQTTNWICRTCWISDSLPDKFRPVSLNGNDRVNDIDISWNEGYESHKKIYRSYQGEKEEVLEVVNSLLVEFIEYANFAILNFAESREGIITEDKFLQEMRKIDHIVEKLFIESSDIPLPPNDIQDYVELCRQIFGVVYDMFLYFMERNEGKWTKDNQKNLMEKSIKEFNRLLPLVEYEKSKIS